MKKLIVLMLVLCVVFVIGCQPDDHVLIPFGAPRIVISSTSEVGRPWTIFIHRNADVSNRYIGAPEGIPHAKVSIYEDGNFLETLTVDPGNKFYYPTMFTSTTNSPRVGHEYQIKVEADSFATASASYVQPPLVPIDDASMFVIRYTVDSFNSQVQTSNGIEKFTQFTYTADFNGNLTFTDPPGENFYELRFISSSTENYKDDMYYIDLPLGTSIEDGNADRFYGALVSDRSISGKKITTAFSAQSVARTVRGNIGQPLPFSPPKYFTVALRSVTKDYYEYQVRSQKIEAAMRDPYAQPVTTRTNVVNGMGVFFAATPASKTVHLPIFPQ